MSLIKIHGYVLQLLLIKENIIFTTASSLDGVMSNSTGLMQFKIHPGVEENKHWA